MTTLLVILAVVLAVIGWLGVGAITRIALAVEAQNEHYGIAAHAELIKAADVLPEVKA